MAAVQSGIDNGLHRGCQLYVSRDRSALVNVAIGEAADGVPMTNRTINLWRSSGKPMTAAAVLRATQPVELDQPLATLLPEFSDESITLAHLLTHTSGLPNIDVGWPAANWNSILETICAQKRNPDVKAAYSYFGTWFLLGEILRRRVDADHSFGRVIRETLFEPLGMTDTWNGMTAETYEEISTRIAQVETITLSGRKRLEPLHEETSCVPASPGANLRSTARDVGRFYEALQNDEVFPCRETLNLMTSCHRDDLVDETFKAKVRMGLGVILASDDPSVPYGFGDHCSSQTYGHGGAQCAMAFCDPQHRLVVAWVVNGFPGEPKHQERNRSINSAVYADLGLATR